MESLTVERLRNIILLSHGGAGKTSLAESLLFATGAISRMGLVEDGNTTSDYEPEEVKRESSKELHGQRNASTVGTSLPRLAIGLGVFSGHSPSCSPEGP